MAAIYEYNRAYAIGRFYVDWFVRRSYRHIRYVGMDRIPQDGAIIFAPNHCNALCDALAVLCMNKQPKVFVARADIFRKPKIRAILTWLKMMPIRRIRDGINEVRNNDATIDAAVDTLRHGVPFVIMPEGTHRTKHSLLPLAKGIFRIALQANDVFGDQKPVYIVPVGLEYGDYFHLYDHLTLQIGEPLNITEYVASHPQTPRPQIINDLLDDLTRRMQATFLWVPDDEQYDANSQALLLNPPEPFAWMKRKPLSLLQKSLLLVSLAILSPIFAVCAIICLPQMLMPLLAKKLFKDKAFHCSFVLVAQLLLFPLLLFIQWPFWLFAREYLYWCRRLSR